MTLFEKLVVIRLLYLMLLNLELIGYLQTKPDKNKLIYKKMRMLRVSLIFKNDGIF